MIIGLDWCSVPST